MVVSTVFVALGTMLQLIGGAFRSLPQDAAAGARTGLRALDVGHYLALFGLYAAAGVVILGTLTMEGPAEVGPIPVSDASVCVIILTVQYFAVHLAAQIAATVDELKGARRGPSLAAQACGLAKRAVACCPVLSVILLA